MDHKILFSLIFMIESSFQDKVWNPYCNYKSGLETIEEFCCPRCKQDNNKEKCHYECPIDYFRFGKRCYGIPQNNIEHSMPFSPFVCNRKCPKSHYGIALNETKICVSCSILCLDTSIETACSCAVSEKETDIKTVLIITNIITALLFIAATCISISCYYQKRKMDKRSERDNIGNCNENYNIEAKVEQLNEINDNNSMNTGHTAEEINENKTMDTDHKAENDIAVAAQRQHEKITRYTRDPTILPKKKTKEKERVKSSDYANVSAIRINKLLNRKTISRAVSQFFGRKQETNNSKFIEDVVIEQNTTPTQDMHGDDANCPSNIQFAEENGENISIVSSEQNEVQEIKQHIPCNKHKVHTVIKTTQLSKSNVLKNETIDKTEDNRDTTNIQSNTGNSTPNAIGPVGKKNITKKLEGANELLHDTNGNGENIPVSTNKANREIGQKDETLDSIKQVTFAAGTNTKTKFDACTDKNDLSICDQTSNKLYENYKTEMNNFTDNKLEEQTDHNHFVRRNKSLLRMADRGSKASTNSNKSTISSNSKSAESDVSSVSFKTAPSESPRLSEVDDNQQYVQNEGTVKDRSSSSDTEGQTVYENIPYLSGMETTLRTDSESHTTEINDLDKGATTDINNHPVEVLTPISEKIEDSQLVTTRDNRVSSGSDESFHSVQNQCLDLDSQDEMGKSNVRYNAINSTKSFDMRKIKSQTNMSFNNSSVTLVINQSN
ncbi:uncharacterized protein LOC143080548 [Mytilus galloprovincialis]|uniref:uncharacterized protein LOC143080548 n=1 Tax=Mytilus galloprovincialis TaxID=29158 RepID=UPI003F7BF8F2